MILIKWLSSCIRKKRCKYGLYLLGRERNMREAQQKDLDKESRKTKGAIAHHEDEKVGKRKNSKAKDPKRKPITKIRNIIVALKKAPKLDTKIRKLIFVSWKTPNPPKMQRNVPNQKWICAEPLKSKNPKEPRAESQAPQNLKTPKMTNPMLLSTQNLNDSLPSSYHPTKLTKSQDGHVKIRKCANKTVSELEKAIDNPKKTLKEIEDKENKEKEKREEEVKIKGGLTNHPQFLLFDYHREI